MTFPTPLRIEVTWTDSGTARGEVGWEQKDKILSDLSISNALTSGYLLGKDEKTLYVAQSFDPEHGNYLNAQAIQSSAIIKIVVLRARESIMFDNLP